MSQARAVWVVGWFCALSLFLGACGGAPALSVRAGSAFIVDAEGSPASGYVWEAEYDPAQVELVDHAYEATSASGGRFSFTFKALKAGETRVTLLRKRPADEQAAERKIFLVKVEESK